MAWLGKSEKYPEVQYNADEINGRIQMVLSRKMDNGTEQHVEVSVKSDLKAPVTAEQMKDKAEAVLEDLNRFSRQEYVKDSSLKIERIGLDYPKDEIDGNLYPGIRKEFVESFLEGKSAKEVQDIYRNVPGYTQREIQEKFRKRESARIICRNWDSGKNGFKEMTGKPVGIPFGARGAQIEGVTELAISGKPEDWDRKQCFGAIFLDAKFIDGRTEKTGQPCFVFQITGPGKKTDKGTVYPISVPKKRLERGYKDLTEHRAFRNMTILIPEGANIREIEKDPPLHPRQEEKRRVLVSYRLANNAYPKSYKKIRTVGNGIERL